MTKASVRKQLREPDEFLTVSHRVWDFVSRHASRVAVMGGVAVAIIAAVWAWTHYDEGQARKATAMLSRAIDIYNQTVLPSGVKPPTQTDDGLPRFKTRQEKLRAAEEELSKVIDTYGSRSIGMPALVMRGSVRYERGQYDKAIGDYRRYLERGGDDRRFKVAALEGLGYAHEATKQWDAALEAFRKLPADGDERFTMLYHEARVFHAKGQTAEAIQRLKQVIAKSSTPALVRQAGLRLAALQGETPGSSKPKK